ncbi:hypothetical protein AAG906_014357 [Vitis piasezkii]
MMEELLGQVKARILKFKGLNFKWKHEHKPWEHHFARKEQWRRENRVKETAAVFFRTFEALPNSGSQESNASNCVCFGAETRKIWPSEDNCSRCARISHTPFSCANGVRNSHTFFSFSKYGCYVMAWMQSHGNFSHPEVISYELLEGEVFNSKFCINPLEPISMAIESNSIQGINFVDTPLKLSYHESNQMAPLPGKVPQAHSHYDHEKDKFAYLSMRDRIELGKRQVQQSQWGSKYALNGDDSYEHTVGECPTIPTMRDMYGYQSSYTSSWNNYPNLTTQPQPQSSMSTSSLEQAILKLSKVMEDFVGEQQKINSHLNEKIDNLESSMNVRMEEVYNDLSLRIEKVQDSIEKLTNLDIERGKGSFLLNPTITFKEPMQKDQGKC